MTTKKLDIEEEQAESIARATLAGGGLPVGVAEADKRKLEQDRRDYEREQKRRASEPKPPKEPSAAEREAAAVRALPRFVARAERDGDDALARKLSGIADQARADLDEARKLSAEADRLPQPTATLDAACEAVGKALVRMLPGAFADAGEAATYARRELPMTPARSEFRRQETELSARRQQAGVALRRFWEGVLRAARLSFHRVNDDENLSRLFSENL